MILVHYLILVIISANAQIHWTNLTKIGVFNLGSKDYKITSDGPYQNIVVKLMPNIEMISNCTAKEITNYQTMVRDILTPIKDAIDTISSAMEPKTGSERFFGIILAGAALGVATSAQITAGMALENTRINAENIEKLKDALKKSNKAIDEIRLGQEQTILAVQGVQDYINTEIQPKLSQLGCKTAALEVGLALLRYYTTVITVFGPNLRDPIASHISIQALSSLAGGNLQLLLSRLGYSPNDLLDVLESRSIRGQIVNVDVDQLLIVLSVRYPTITTMEGYQVDEISTISYNLGPEEWTTVLPSFVATRGYILSNLDIEKCFQTKRSVICTGDQTYPMAPILQECLRGDLASCPRSKVIGTSTGRFILYRGNIFANCLATICRCSTTGTLITQDASNIITYIGSEKCPEVVIDGIHITLGEQVFETAIYEQNVVLGPQIVVSKLDVSTELGHAMERLNKSKVLLDQSEKIMSTMTGLSALWGRSAASISMVTILIIIIVIITGIFCLKKYNDRQYGTLHNHGSTPSLPNVQGLSSSYIRTIS
nr:MAG: fusion protein [Wufeng rodent morbillivirus 1]